MSRIHPATFKVMEKSEELPRPSKRLGTNIKTKDLSKNQPKITDYAIVSPVMQLAVNLAVHKGLSFSTFDSEDMRKLVLLAKTGAKDGSKRVVNADNVKSSVKYIADVKRNEIQSNFKGKIVNLSADFATCERRSFLGKS